MGTKRYDVGTRLTGARLTSILDTSILGSSILGAYMKKTEISNIILVQNACSIATMMGG